MKQKLILYSLLTLVIVFIACKPDISLPSNNDNTDSTKNSSTRMKIKIGSKTFNATLADNPTAMAFRALLPLTINMTELNGNEKYFRLSKNLPVNPTVPASIQKGDLLMYGSNTLVLFYETFSTSYSYTRLGKIDDTAGLAASLGSGDIKVTIE